MGKPRKPALRHVLATNVRQERISRAWAQEELGHRAELSQTYISQIESGQRAVSVDAIESLADAFGIDAVQLLQKG